MSVSAEYHSPDLTQHFEVKVADKSALPKEIDRDAAQESSTSVLGELRTKSMIMQQNINVFLTERMKQASSIATADEEDIEKKILDGDEGIEGDDDDEDE